MATKLVFPLLVLLVVSSCSNQSLAEGDQEAPPTLKITKADPTRYLPQQMPEKKSFFRSSFPSHSVSSPRDIDLPPLPKAGGTLNHGLLPPINGQPATVQSEQPLPQIPDTSDDANKPA